MKQRRIGEYQAVFELYASLCKDYTQSECGTQNRERAKELKDEVKDVVIIFLEELKQITQAEQAIEEVK